MPPFLPDVPEVREDLADYFGEIQAWDSALGLLLARLEAIGELDNTMIVVSGDHGAPGFHTESAICTTLDRAFRSRFDGVERKGGRVVDDLVSLTDLAPTFLEAAGLDVPGSDDRRSLMPLLTSENRARSMTLAMRSSSDVSAMSRTLERTGLRILSERFVRPTFFTLSTFIPNDGRSVIHIGLKILTHRRLNKSALKLAQHCRMKMQV